MTRPPRFDDAALRGVLGGRAPAALSREGRVRLLGRAAEALLRGELPDGEARTFLAAAVLAWLEQGGSLTRDYLKVDPVRGSKRTPAAIWRARHRDDAVDEEDRL